MRARFLPGARSRRVCTRIAFQPCVTARPAVMPGARRNTVRRKKRNGLQDGELSSFCMEAALLLHAGVGVGEGLRLLAQEDESGRADLLAAMARRTDGGETLSAAMEAAGVFPDYAVGLTAVGERSATSAARSCIRPCCFS